MTLDGGRELAETVCTNRAQAACASLCARGPAGTTSVTLNNRRPDVTVYRADTIDLTPTRPEHVLLVVEVVSPGSETTDRIVKADQYARAGIAFYWRIERAATGAPLVHTYLLDAAIGRYRAGELFTGKVTISAPFPLDLDLSGV